MTIFTDVTSLILLEYCFHLEKKHHMYTSHPEAAILHITTDNLTVVLFIRWRAAYGAKLSL